MTKLQKITVEQAEGRVKNLLETARKSNGKEINLLSVMANSPATLEAYLNFSAILSKGSLDPMISEKLAVAVAGYNKCSYCASAHTYIGSRKGISKEELAENLSGQSADEKSATAINFAIQLVDKRGQVSESEIQAVRNAGYSDEEIVEILSHVALNTFTNYFNVAFDTEVDFPLVNTDL